MTDGLWVDAQERLWFEGYMVGRLDTAEVPATVRARLLERIDTANRDPWDEGGEG